MKRGIEGGLRKYQSNKTDDLISFAEGPAEEAASVLKKLRPGEYISKGFPATGVREMERYISHLQEAGLDVSRSDDAEYGFKMPLPEKDCSRRELIIFRRRKA